MKIMHKSQEVLILLNILTDPTGSKIKPKTYMKLLQINK